jgi:poly(3-hydroxyalkanoate) depolymerase
MGTLRLGRQLLRVGYRSASGRGLPLLVFNGIGGNIELLDPFARRLSGRDVITFDIPGVGHSPLPRRPYRLRHMVGLAVRVLDHFGHRRCDAMGISWGGALAQEFALRQGESCRRLILCATAPGALMIPGRPSVLWKLATPRRFVSPEYARRVSGDIYGGDFRRNIGPAMEVFRHVRWQSRLGYYLQLGAVAGWTSLHWLHELEQPTLLMAGADDPIVPLENALLMRRLIPDAELRVFDCGHLFLLTRLDEATSTIEEFLNRR